MINWTYIQEKIRKAVEPIEGKQPNYICEYMNKRCPYLGGDTLCPKEGLHNCVIGMTWVRSQNERS